MINLKLSKTQKPQIFSQLFIKSHCCFAQKHMETYDFNDTDESEPSYHSYPSRTPRMPCFGKHRCWLAQESSAPKPFVPRQGRRNTAEWVNRLWLACWDHGAKWSEWCSLFFQVVFRGRLIWCFFNRKNSPDAETFSSHGGGEFLRPGDPMGWLCGASKLCPDGRQGPGVVWGLVVTWTHHEMPLKNSWFKREIAWLGERTWVELVGVA